MFHKTKGGRRSIGSAALFDYRVKIMLCEEDYTKVAKEALRQYLINWEKLVVSAC